MPSLDQALTVRMAGTAQDDFDFIESLLLPNISQLPQATEPTPAQAKEAKAETEEQRVEKLRILLDQMAPDESPLMTPNALDPTSLLFYTSSAKSKDRTATSKETVPKLKPILPNSSWLAFMSGLQLAAKSAHAQKQAQQERPNCTYQLLISLAIYSTGTGSATVKEIYQFITNHFPYYGYNCTCNWKNSVRHCLSESKAIVKVTTYTRAGQVTRKGCRWTITMSSKDEIEMDIVKFLAEEPFDLRHIGPLSKFYAEIDFRKVQEGISRMQEAQAEVSPTNACVDLESLGWADPCAASSAAAAVTPPPQVQTETIPPPADGHGQSQVSDDFQDLLGDILGSALGDEAGEREGCVFDEDLAQCLLAEMATAPCLLNEVATNPVSAPSTAAAAEEEGTGGSTEDEMDAALLLLSTLQMEDLLKEIDLEDPALVQ